MFPGFSLLPGQGVPSYALGPSLSVFICTPPSSGNSLKVLAVNGTVPNFRTNVDLLWEDAKIGSKMLGFPLPAGPRIYLCTYRAHGRT